MDNRLKFQQLECYKLATDEQKEKLNKEQYFDLDKLPGNQLQTEFVEYIYYRGTQVSILTIKRERHYFNSLCEFFQKSSHQENSLLDREKDFWIKQLKMWMIQNGRALTKHKVTNIQTESVEKAALIRYFESLLEFTLDRSETNELAKDIWHLERLPLILRTNPIVNHKTLNFRGIRQPDIREEVKKAIYHHLKTEALGSIKRELSAMNKFSKYLDEKHSKISTCEEIDREIIEQFLINIKVESNGGNGIRDDLLKLRNVLETIGKIYDFPHLTKLFLKSDFPPERKAEFKSYSDSELKRLNAQIVKTLTEDMTDYATDEISTILRRNHKLKASDDDDFTIRTQQELSTMLNSTTDLMTTLLACIAGISLVVGGIGIMNIMYVSVTERTREIGLRMSVGARGVDILSQFLIEAIMISITGGIIGVIIGCGASWIVKSVAHWPIYIQPWSVFLSFAVCTVTGVFFGWYPAKKAADLDPIEAIRYE